MKSFEEQYDETHLYYCHNCEAHLEEDWNFCPYCGKKNYRKFGKLATKLGGKQPDSVKQKISESIKEFWEKRKKS